MATEQVYAVPAPGKAAWVTLLAILVAAPLLLLVVSGIKADPMPPEQLLLPSAIMIVVTLALGLLMRRRSVTLGGDRLVVRAAMYTQSIALDALDIDAARVVDLDERTEWAPRMRINGYSLPGFKAGYFRGRGKQRLFALLTSRRRVLVLPERSGRIVLLSLQQPQPLLAELQRREPRANAER